MPESGTPSSLRAAVAGRLGARLPTLLTRAKAHEPAALGQLAALRRGVGRGFGSDPASSQAFATLVDLPSRSDPDPGGRAALRRLVDDAFLACTLVAWSRVNVSRSRQRWGSFGADLLRLKRQPEMEAAAERVFKPIVGSDRVGIEHHLRRAFALLASVDLQVEVAPLIRDLGYWDAENEWVKRRWAEDFWIGLRLDEDVADEDEEEWG